MLKIKVKNKELAFIILIGGRSNRFGTDKCFFEFKGKALIEHQLDVLTQFPYSIFIVANSKEQIKNCLNKINFEKIMAFIIDETDILDKNFRSAMLGLYSAFKELRILGYQKAFALSCDNPLIKYEVIDYMIKECKNYECCIPRWNSGFLEPLFAIYPIEKAYKSSIKNLEKRRFKLVNLISDTWKTNYVSIDDTLKKMDLNLMSFKNINAPEDIKTLE
ncbi:MAG: molybdenum cofactor guanylyltransferase [Promethearchaeota archaeon]